MKVKKQLSPEVKVNLDYIKALVNEASGVDLSSKNSTLEYVKARRLFVYLVNHVYKLTSRKVNYILTYQQLANYIGYNNHDQVIYLFKNSEFYLRQDSDLKEDFERLKIKITNRDNTLDRINYLKIVKENLGKQYIEVSEELESLCNKWKTEVLGETLTI